MNSWIAKYLGPRSQPEILLSLVVEVLFHPTIQNITTRMQATELTALSHSQQMTLLPLSQGISLRCLTSPLLTCFHTLIISLSEDLAPFSNLGFGAQHSWLLQVFFVSFSWPFYISISCSLLEPFHNLGNMIEFLLSPYHQNQILFLIQHPLQLML